MISFRKMLFDESAQGLVEYSLILSLVTLFLISVVMSFGDTVDDLYKSIVEVINAL